MNLLYILTTATTKPSILRRSESLSWEMSGRFGLGENSTKFFIVPKGLFAIFSCVSLPFLGTPFFFITTSHYHLFFWTSSQNPKSFCDVLLLSSYIPTWFLSSKLSSLLWQHLIIMPSYSFMFSYTHFVKCVLRTYYVLPRVVGAMDTTNHNK